MAPSPEARRAFLKVVSEAEAEIRRILDGALAAFLAGRARRKTPGLNPDLGRGRIAFARELLAGWELRARAGELGYEEQYGGFDLMRALVDRVIAVARGLESVAREADLGDLYAGAFAGGPFGRLVEDCRQFKQLSAIAADAADHRERNLATTRGGG